MFYSTTFWPCLLVWLFTLFTCGFLIAGGLHYIRDLNESADERITRYDAVKAQEEADNYIYTVSGKDIRTVGIIGKQTRYVLYYDVTYTFNGETDVHTDEVFVTESVFDSVSIGDLFDVASVAPVESAPEASEPSIEIAV